MDIVEAGFDAGVRFGEGLQQDMVAVPLGPPQRFVVVASKAYLAAHGAPLHPNDLAQHRCIRIRFPSGTLYRWEFAKGSERLAVDVSGPLTVGGSMPLMVRAAEDGLGLAYVCPYAPGRGGAAVTCWTTGARPSRGSALLPEPQADAGRTQGPGDLAAGRTVAPQPLTIRPAARWSNVRAAPTEARSASA